MTGQPAHTDADVQAALRAFFGLPCDFEWPAEALQIGSMCAVLDAVVPAIVARAKAEALRDAAAEMRRTLDGGSTLGGTSDDWLRSRADEIEAGR